MKQYLKSLLIFGAAFGFLPRCSFAVDRNVSVSTTITTHSGSPVVGVGVHFQSELGVSCATTDAQGKVVVNVKLPLADSTVYIVPSVCDGNQVSEEASFAVLKALRDQAAIEASYSLRITAQQADASFAIIAKESVRVKGAVSNADGRGSYVVLRRLGGDQVSKYNRESQEAVLSGVPKGEQSEIAVLYPSGLVEFRPVSVSQTAADFNLGSLSSAAPLDGAVVKLTVAKDAGWPAGGESVSKDVALIRDDRGVLFNGPLSRDSIMRPGWEVANGQWPKLPPGKYYVGVGNICSSWINTELWKALKRPDAQQVLEQSQWPTITVPESGSIETQIAAADVVAAARRLRGF